MLANQAKMYQDTIATRQRDRYSIRFVICAIVCAHITGWIFAGLLVRTTAGVRKGAGDDINNIVPPIGTKLVKFDFNTANWVPGPGDDNVTDAIFDNWSEMLPKGGGRVKVPNWEDYRYLQAPAKLNNNIPAYNTAWTHELHCVYWIMREYHRVLHHGPDGSEYFIDPTHNSYHTSHCFNYIRQAILCGLDTTLEGRGEGVGVPDGSGQYHICRDDSQSIQWLEAHRHDDHQAIT